MNIFALALAVVCVSEMTVYLKWHAGGYGAASLIFPVLFLCCMLCQVGEPATKVSESKHLRAKQQQ